MGYHEVNGVTERDHCGVAFSLAPFQNATGLGHDNWLNCGQSGLSNEKICQIKA